MSEQRGLHIHGISTEQDVNHPHACFAVMSRENGAWSPGAKVMAIRDTETEAEAEAERLKERQPHLMFGVFALRSEARPTPKPVEIVRVE